MKRKQFVHADLRETTGLQRNPGCGWYRMVTFDVSKPPRTDDITPAEDASLVLLRLDLSAYQKKPLDEPAQVHIKRILSTIRGLGLDVILRAAYDVAGNGMEHEPANAELVEEHLRQLGTLLVPFADCLLVVQGLLVGSWGEMHTSKFLGRPQLIRLNRALRETLPETVPTAVRQPVQWRMLKKPDDPEVMPVGLFNDALFGSETDLGTYGAVARETSGWYGQWLPEEEITFGAQLSSRVPFGGEAVLGETSPSAEAVLERLRRMQATYLSCEWDSRLLDQWRAIPCGADGLWQDASLYEYVGAHLGYRLLVSAMDVKPDLMRKRCAVQFTLINQGFAPMYRRADVILLHISPEGVQTEYELGTLEKLPPKASATFSHTIPMTCGRLHLLLRQSSDQRPIQTANHREDKTVPLLLGEISIQ